MVRVSVHEDLGKPPPPCAFDLALAAARSGCPVVSLIDDRTAKVRERAAPRAVTCTVEEG